MIIFPAHEAYVTRTHNSDLGGGRLLCREYVLIKKTH